MQTVSIGSGDVDVDGRMGHASCSGNGGLLYTFGGYTMEMEPTDQCMAFDPNTATWVELENLPTPRAMVCACGL